MILENLLFLFVKFCVFLGETILVTVEKLAKYLLTKFEILRNYLQNLIQKLQENSRLVKKRFAIKKKKPEENFFSLTYYLFFYRIKYFIFGFIVAVLIFSVKDAVSFIKSLPNPTFVENYHSELSTHIYDRRGKLLYEVYRDQNRTPVALKNLPSYIKWATLSIEDKDFYSHNGVSFFGGILRAGKETFFKKKLQGGSTITQQLVKSALLTPERTITRKIKEIVLALIVERTYPKDKILEMYLNQVPYGGTAWGVEEASKMYFGKSAKDISVSEAALLAGLPQAPSLYSPFVNPEAAIRRQKLVLKRMYEEKHLTKDEYQKAKSETLVFKKPNTSILAPHFVFYVKDLLESEYGLKAVQEGGLRVYTTLDYTIQKEAETILREELEKIKGLNVGNGAIVVTKPSTGEILAMVGSKDFFDGVSGSFNVTTALRQPGSSVKPITYTLALKKGMTAASLIPDVPTRFMSNGVEAYSPVNYDGKFHGTIPLRYALANSYNIPAVKALELVGVNDFITFAKNMGIEGWSHDRNRYGLSLTLGGGEVTMLEMSTAFGTLRNLGVKHDLSALNRIENSIGQTIFERKDQGTRVIGEAEPFIISDVLSDNVARTWAFGPNSGLNFGNGYVSVKTGTTDNKKDNWTIGYTRPTTDKKENDVLVTVWVGNNDGQPMNPILTSGITGASPIWRRLIERLVSKDLLNKHLYIPDNVESKTCYFGRTEYFVSGTAEKINCAGYKVNSSPTITP